MGDVQQAVERLEAELAQTAKLHVRAQRDALRLILSALSERDAEIERLRAAVEKPSTEMIRAVEFAIYRYSDCSARDAERGAPHVIVAVAATLTKGAPDAR
jgi:hypothetical protein